MYRSKAEENFKNVKDRFVDRNLQGTQKNDFSRIYESIVIEFFFRLKIHKIGTLCSNI